MTYTKKERKAIVRALKACRGYLWDGYGSYGEQHIAGVCFAIEHAWNDGRIAAWDMGYAFNLIDARLNGYSTMKVWLKRRAKISSRDLTNEAVQAHRHAWVNKLIEEFSE